MPAKALPQPQFPVTTRVLGLQAVHLTWTVPVSSLYKDHFATRKIHDVKIFHDISSCFMDSCNWAPGMQEMTVVGEDLPLGQAGPH